MDNHDILPYILYLIGDYNRKISGISKFWDAMYTKATKKYPIKIKFRSMISDEKFIEIVNLPRFIDVLYIDVTHCVYITLNNIYLNNIAKLIVHNNNNIKGIPDFANTLVTLEITCSGITKLPNFTRLKRLEMKYCDHITELPMSNTLEKLTLYLCGVLSSIPDFTMLETLDISFCESIREIPTCIGKTLVELYMDNNEHINSIPDFAKLEILTILNCKITCIPNGTANTLKYLYINSKINTPNFTKLETLNCKWVEKIPTGIQDTLKSLSIYDSNIISLPSFTCLKYLDLGECKYIKEIPISICDTLTYLHIRNEIDIPNFTKLKTLICNRVKKLPTSIQNTLKSLHIFSSDIVTLPSFTCLEHLSLKKCNGIKEIPASVYDTLENIFIDHCKRLIIQNSFAKLKTKEIY